VSSVEEELCNVNKKEKSYTDEIRQLKYLLQRDRSERDLERMELERKIETLERMEYQR